MTQPDPHPCGSLTRCLRRYWRSLAWYTLVVIICTAAAVAGAR